MLQELRLHWGLTTADAFGVKPKDNFALRWAAEHGHVSVLHELRLHWGLTTADYYSSKQKGCCKAVFEGASL